MRFIALFPLLCVVGSFVMSLLAILAGMNASFMENFEIVTVSGAALKAEEGLFPNRSLV